MPAGRLLARGQRLCSEKGGRGLNGAGSLRSVFLADSSQLLSFKAGWASSDSAKLSEKRLRQETPFLPCLCLISYAVHLLFTSNPWYFWEVNSLQCYYGPGCNFGLRFGGCARKHLGQEAMCSKNCLRDLNRSSLREGSPTPLTLGCGCCINTAPLNHWRWTVQRVTCSCPCCSVSQLVSPFTCHVTFCHFPPMLLSPEGSLEKRLNTGHHSSCFGINLRHAQLDNSQNILCFPSIFVMSAVQTAVCVNFILKHRIPKIYRRTVPAHILNFHRMLIVEEI